MKILRARPWFAVVAMWLLLLGTAAPALVRMDCLSSGHSVLSIGQADDCCPPDTDHSNGARIHAVCCEFARTAPERTEFHSVSAPSVVAVLVCGPEPGTGTMPGRLEGLTGYRLMAHPPPLLTAERLSRVGSLLI